MRIVFLDRATLRPETILRPPALPHTLETYASSRPGEVATRVADADVVITNKVPITAETLSDSPSLRLVVVAATGYDVVDIAACRARGVAVCNVRDYAVTTVPEHVFALVLALRRSLFAYREAVLAGRWQDAGQFCFFDYPIQDLAGSTLGVVGGGALGLATARVGAALGMDVLFAGRKGAVDPTPGRTPFAELLASSDVITLHCPLTPDTQNLISDAEFALMAGRPLLINVGRGGLVDEAALGRALDAGLISGAGFDVTRPEPPPADSLLMRLAARPDVIVTPHVAWASRQAVQALADQVIELIEAFARGAPRNRVA